MGKRGPARTPTKVLQMRGSSLADGREAEPEPSGKAPEAPAHLGEVAAAEWRRVVPILEGWGILDEADQTALGIMCEAYGEYTAARALVVKHGPITENAKGLPMKHPAVLIQEGAFTRWKTLMAQFGLTPSARANLAIERKNPDENRGKKRFFG